MIEPTGTAVPERPKARERGRLRRRLRRQRQMREALLLDLGAIVYELHRQGRREPELLQAKAAELKAIDEEVRALVEALDADEGMMHLTAAGIAGSCENCGSLLSTDARYCGACGAAALPALAGPAPAPRAEVAHSDGPALETGEHEAVQDDLLEDDLLERDPEPVRDDPEPVDDEPEPVEDEPEPFEGEPEPVEEEPAVREAPSRGTADPVLDPPWAQSPREG